MSAWQDVSPDAWRAAGYLVAAQRLGVVLGGVDLAEREVYVAGQDAEPGVLDVVLAAGVLSRMQAHWGPGPPLPCSPPASAWVSAAHILDAHISTVRSLAAFLDQVSFMSGEQLDAFWLDEQLDHSWAGDSL